VKVETSYYTIERILLTQVISRDIYYGHNGEGVS
jgi:hypothetical protein